MESTGRVSQARQLMLDAAQMANELELHEVSFPMGSKEQVVSMRQCCYAAQRTWVKQIERAAMAEGKDPQKTLIETFLKGRDGEFKVPPATWPSASIHCRCVDGQYYIVFEFRRIASDPLWSEIIKERLIPGPPPRASKVNTAEIIELEKKDD